MQFKMFDGVLMQGICYVSGTMTVVVLVAWTVFATNSPATNKFTSKKEKEYIVKSLEVESTKQSFSVHMQYIYFLIVCCQSNIIVKSEFLQKPISLHV